MANETYIGNQRLSSGEAKAMLRLWRGKTVRNTSNGKLFIVGEPAGMSDWWIMQVDPPAKARYDCRELARQLELVKE